MDKEFLNRKIDLALNYSIELKKLKFTKQDLKENIDIMAKLYYLYQNVIERCLRIAVYINKINNFKVNASAKETFIELANNNIILRDTAKSLGGAYGFRNALVHDYDTLDLEIIVKSHATNVINLQKYLQEVAKYVREF